MATTWLRWRIVAPLLIGAIVAVTFWGKDYYASFIPMTWLLFLCHVIGTYRLRPTHAVDRMSFLFLFTTCSAVCELSEPTAFSSLPLYLLGAGAFATYSILSYVGYRLSRRNRVEERFSSQTNGSPSE